MRHIALQNLGCSKNLIDGERILHLCSGSGVTITTDLAAAEVIIVNTCAFIREAQEEAIEVILTAAAYKKTGVCRQLIVSGCFSERFRNEVAATLPEVDYWVGVNDWEERLSDIFSVNKPTSFERVLSKPVATQYLKIAEGCSHHCSFCVIPAIRGPFISRSTDAVLAEAQWLEASGVRELVLVAQDSSFYGKEQGGSLAALLRELLAQTALPWIRVMYLHPNFVTNELLELIAQEPRICPYFDIPLQHIAEPILRSMKRMPSTSGIYALVERIRSMVPGASIRSAFILGYPGETEAHFRELQRFIEWARFDKLGVFPYSPEEGTAAVALRPRPRAATANRRCEELMLLQREISREINEQRIGSTVEVIVDRLADDPDFNFEARSRCDAPEVDGKVLLRNGSLAIGSIVPVRIIGSSDYDLFAEVV